jgi:LacI family transcriptional regulator
MPVLMEKEVTIYDIADQLSISPSTVSRALNDHPAINQSTKNKIHAAANAMGYQTNRFARNLRMKSTMTLGVLVPKLDSVFLATVLGGMEKVANEAGYNLIITQSLESEIKEKTNVETLFNSRVDGLLVSATVSNQQTDVFRKFLRKKIPTVFFDRILEIEGTQNIVIDNEQAGYEATQHLISTGKRRLWHVTGDIEANVYKGRYAGFMRAVQEAGLPLADEHLIIDSIHLSESENLVDKILSASDRPDAIFFTNDTAAALALVRLVNRGIRVPDDIAIFGFNNDPIATLVVPNISTVYYPAKEIGEVAARNLIRHLNGQEILKEKQITIGHRLVIREST